MAEELFGKDSFSLPRRAIEKKLRTVGIEIDGKNPWDIKINDQRFYARVFSQGSLGLGEAYMMGWWDAERPDLFIEKVLRGGHYANSYSWPSKLLNIKGKVFNRQTRSRSKEVAEQHYNLDTKFFETFLDPYNQYTCAYFSETDELNEAQEKKLDLICRKLQLKEGDTVLDIGCGWGGFAKYAAEKYGCKVVGITISEEQAKSARAFTQNLERGAVDIRVQDYRDLKGGKFDKISAVGVMEHIGHKNYRQFMETAQRMLKDDGLFFVDTLGQDFSGTAGNPWSDKYIFPNGMAPSLQQITGASAGLLVLEDMQNLGIDYYKTLRKWDENFQRNWPAVQDRYPAETYRMYRYYFNSFAGALKAQRIHDWHVVFSKGKTGATYKSAR